MSDVYKTESFVSEIDRILKKSSTLAKKLSNLKKEWQLDDSFNDVSPVLICEDAISEISNNNKKLNSEEMFCVVLGRVSSGKSALLNAMLGEGILPSGKGSTTNSFVEIRKSNDNSEYLLFSGCDKRENLDSISLVKFGKNKKKINDSIVKLFYLESKCELLHKNVVFVDTPGFDIQVQTDKIITEICKQSGVLILVINSCNDISNNEMEFLSKHKTTFSRFDLIVVFNQWDQIEDSDKEYFKETYTNIANDYLCGHLGVKNNRDDDGIFFLSSKERLEVKLNKTPTESDWECRNASFENFINLINEKLILYQNKRQIIKDRNIEIMTRVFNTIKSVKHALFARMTEKIQAHLEKLLDINKDISEAVKMIVKQNYEIFLGKGFEAMRINKLDQSEIASSMNTFITEQITVLIESTKIVIKDNLAKSDIEDKEYVTKIFDNIYFPYYFNGAVLMSVLKLEDLCPAFREIVEKIDLHRKFAIAGIATAGVLVVAPVGIVIGIFVPIIDAIAIPIGATVAAGIGGVSGAISSWYSLTKAKLERKVFKGRYMEYEKQITEWWSIMENNLVDSYTIFKKDIRKAVESYMTDIESDFVELKSDADRFFESNVIVQTMY